MSERKKIKKVFVEGPIPPHVIADVIVKHALKKNIGAHNIFLGQVRADVIEDKTVTGIEYSCYEEMAEMKLDEIRETAFSKFNLICAHMYHSKGKVNAGGICLFVFTSSIHRADAFESCRWIVDEIKKNVPIWGKEIFEDQTRQWKVNKL